MADKGALIFEGKEKNIYATSDPDKVLIHFKDTTTAFGGIKKAVLKDKGIYNNAISSIIFRRLTRAGIPNHFLHTQGDRGQVCRRIEIIPLQVIVRNRLAGTTASLLGVEEGTRIPNVVYELRYNCDTLSDPMINAHHAVALGIVNYREVEEMMELARRVNEELKKLFSEAGIELIDFKMECGRSSGGQIILCDEISPDNSRLWDIATSEKLDKDRFRHDMSDVCASYREVMTRLQKIESL